MPKGGPALEARRGLTSYRCYFTLRGIPPGLIGEVPELLSDGRCYFFFFFSLLFGYPGRSLL